MFCLLVVIVVGGRYTSGLLFWLVAGGTPMVAAFAGGTVAGYLRGDSVVFSAIAGALAGAIVFLPAGVLALGYLLVQNGGLPSGSLLSQFLAAIYRLFVSLLIVGFYVALSASGGVAGAGLTDRTSPLDV